ncbi:MAG: helix-turn-helix domain-containing protein [Bacteroidetes bacterium]|jgi:transcriptional regulator with XRE-family HTH domain|nr:helix-turn-helix domain-containing protein [Bacteroidota bacterium]
MHKMNFVARKIKQIRTQQGISQEYMAEELGITQPSYARLETEDARINIVRLMLIAKVLEVPASELLGEKAQNINNQSHNETANAYNVERVNKIINADKNHIESLKEEIVFLREVLKKKVDHA